MTLHPKARVATLHFERSCALRREAPVRMRKRNVSELRLILSFLIGSNQRYRESDWLFVKTLFACYSDMLDKL